jgi:thiamine biosynthesis lipoprotein
MISRRRFLTIAACASLASPAAAADVHEWRGVALGSEVRIALAGTRSREAFRIFPKVERILQQVEAHFSLFRDSELTRLNRDGRLSYPSSQMLAVCELAGQVHRATGGHFDPSIQPMWQAVALGHDVKAARALVNWQRVKVSATEITLAPRMQLTFNGIAQGHAADCVAGLLRGEGYGSVLIDTGEIAAIGSRPGGGPWTAGIAMPDGRIVGNTALSDRALATSSPRGTLIGGGKPHIMDPRGQEPRWQLASVSARSAAVADALSTAFCLMDRSDIGQALPAFPGAALEALI